jgi:hypothetical protein
VSNLLYVVLEAEPVSCSISIPLLGVCAQVLLSWCLWSRASQHWCLISFLPALHSGQLSCWAPCAVALLLLYIGWMNVWGESIIVHMCLCVLPLVNPPEPCTANTCCLGAGVMTRAVDLEGGFGYRGMCVPLTTHTALWWLAMAGKFLTTLVFECTSGVALSSGKLHSLPVG